MNHRADSRKKNLLDAVMQPCNCQQGWFLSHRCEHGHNRKSASSRLKQVRLNALSGAMHSLDALTLAFGALTLEPFALDPSKPLRHRFLQRRHILREQKESERQV
jgi:hypothetical protein